MSSIGHVFNNQLGAVGEVFSGTLHTWPQESVAHQGFSTASTVLPLVRGLFGLEGDAIRKLVSFSPHFPADWRSTSVENYQIGKAIFSFRTERRTDKLVIQIDSKNSTDYTLKLTPALGIGTEITSVKIEGNSIPFKVQESSQLIHPQITIPLKANPVSVEILFNPHVEILPPVINSKVGDRNRGLRILSLKRIDEQLILECEGLAGETYSLGMVNGALVKDVQGAELERDRVEIQFPSTRVGEYVRKKVVITSR